MDRRDILKGIIAIPVASAIPSVVKADEEKNHAPITFGVWFNRERTKRLKDEGRWTEDMHCIMAIRGRKEIPSRVLEQADYVIDMENQRVLKCRVDAKSLREWTDEDHLNSWLMACPTLYMTQHCTPDGDVPVMTDKIIGANFYKGLPIFR